MARDEFIKTLTGQIVGIIRYFDNGDQAAIGYPSMRILGYYRKNLDATTNLTGKILSRGNSVAALLYTEQN